MRKRICVIAFSWLHLDGRVLRQIRHLSRRFDVTAVGWGPAPTQAQVGPGLEYRRLRAAEPPRVTPRGPTAPARKLAYHLRRGSLGTTALCNLYERANSLGAGRLWPGLYERAYWANHQVRVARQALTGVAFDAIHANDWEALPVAAEAADRRGAKLVFDAHEYGPLQFENRPDWTRRRRRLVEHLLARYAPRADAVVTVCEPLAERYRRELGVEVEVVHNAPEYQEAPDTETRRDSDRIDLVHHGVPDRHRQPEGMIEALAASDARFHLHLMLIHTASRDYARLQRLAARLAPGRVTFHEPVPPERIVAAVAPYDAGLWVCPPTTYNLDVAIPNKVFEWLIAGLPIVCGPTVGAGRFVAAEGVGVVTPSFDPDDVAAALDTLTPAALARMRARCRDAARRYNAGVELGRLVAIYERLLCD